MGNVLVRESSNFAAAPTVDSRTQGGGKILEFPSVKRPRRVPISLEAFEAAEQKIQANVPVAEAADHAASHRHQPLRRSVDPRSVVSGLGNRSRESLTLRELQQVNLLGDRAPLHLRTGTSAPASPGRPAAGIKLHPQGAAEPSHQSAPGLVPVGPAPAPTHTTGTVAAPLPAPQPIPPPPVGAVGIKNPGARAARTRSKRGANLSPKASANSRSLLADQARRLAAQRAAGTAQPAQQFSPAHQVAHAYEHCLGVYRIRRALRYLRGDVQPGSPNYASWVAAARCADELGMDYLTYVRAQFWFFHRWFARAASPHELRHSATGKVPAMERARAYAELLASGEVPPDHDVCAKALAAAPRPVGARAEQSEDTLRQLCKRHEMSVDDVFRNFARGSGAAALFDRAWLDAHPVYCALRDAGEL